MNSLASADTAVNLLLIKRNQQNVWTGRAVINFALGGTGAALYVLSGWLRFYNYSSSAPITRITLPLISIAFVACGLLAVASETGRPLRARYLLTNIRRSWMARESLAAMIFLTVGPVNLLIQNRLMFVV